MRMRAKGFSLVEILIAIGILGVGLAMVAIAFPLGLQQSKRTVDASRAALAAQSIASLLQAKSDKILNANPRLIVGEAKKVDGSLEIVSMGAEGDAFCVDSENPEQSCFVCNPWREVYGGSVDWANVDPADYRVHVWLTPKGDRGPWLATIVVCRYGENDDVCGAGESSGGDWLLEGNTGYCYQLESTEKLTGKHLSGSEAPSAVGNAEGIRNVVAVYYTLVSP